MPISLQAQASPERTLCLRCLSSNVTCYCARVRPIRTQAMRLVILQHPLERKRSVGTARMAHLCIENSALIAGVEFGQNPQVNGIIADPSHHCVVLYPGSQSLNMSKLPPSQIRDAFPSDLKLVIFVIDGTWACAKKMVARSPNLLRLPQICFTPDRESEYTIRQQPEPHCWSTIEAVHRMIELLEPETNAQNLMDVFRGMVAKQKEYAGNNRVRRVKVYEPLTS